jgi:predicted transposase/invertase (TIGR01784 family)
LARAGSRYLARLCRRFSRRRFFKGEPMASEKFRLSLSIDLVFKTVFSRHIDLLTDLINAVRHGQPPVTVEEILNPGIPPEDGSGKQIVLDILARDENGVLINIEMQVRFLPYWADRGVYYTARALAGQLKTGEQYDQLKPVIGINLLVDDLFPEYSDQACWRFSLRDERRPSVQLGQSLEIHVVELKKAEVLRDLPPALTDWVTSFLHSPEEAVTRQITHPPVLEAIQKMETMFSEEEQQLRAFRRQIALMDEQVLLKDAKQRGKKEGLEQGLEQGRAEGEAKGRAEGKAEGAAEGRATLLLQQLSHKFGSLPANARQRVTLASVDELDAWALNLLDAASLDEVFRKTQ